MIWAFEVNDVGAQFSRQFFNQAVAHGVLIRPIGNTVYFMPPYVITDEEFAFLVAQTLRTLDAVLV